MTCTYTHTYVLTDNMCIDILKVYMRPNICDDADASQVYPVNKKYKFTVLKCKLYSSRNS